MYANKQNTLRPSGIIKCHPWTKPIISIPNTSPAISCTIIKLSLVAITRRQTSKLLFTDARTRRTARASHFSFSPWSDSFFKKKPPSNRRHWPNGGARGHRRQITKGGLSAAGLPSNNHLSSGSYSRAIHVVREPFVLRRIGNIIIGVIASQNPSRIWKGRLWHPVTGWYRMHQPHLLIFDILRKFWYWICNGAQNTRVVNP